VELGGSNDLSNRALLCVPCARQSQAIAKVERIRRRLGGRARPKQQIRSRGFPRDP
jgi:hypothetical protein